VRHAAWRPLPTLRLAGLATVAVLASSVLVGPGVASIRADDELLGAAAIDPTGDDVPLAPLTAAADPSAADPSAADPSAADPDVISAPPATIEMAPEPTSVPTDAFADATADATAGADATVDEATPSSTPVDSAPAAPATTVVETSVELPPAAARPVRILVVGDSTALYTGQGLAEWSTTVPDHAQVSVSWCPGCTFEHDSAITSFDVDGVEESSRRTMLELVPEAVRELRPDLVVMMVTVSDVANRQWSAEEGELGPLDPRYRERMVTAYADRTMALIQMGVPDVVWVVPPTPNHLWNEPEMNEIERFAVHHEIIREVAGRFASHVSLVDLDAWVTASGLVKDNGFRADGVHIDQGPAAAMAAQFLGPWLVREALTPDT
jgi:hypothetical protein